MEEVTSDHIKRKRRGVGSSVCGLCQELGNIDGYFEHQLHTLMDIFDTSEILC